MKWYRVIIGAGEGYRRWAMGGRREIRRSAAPVPTGSEKAPAAAIVSALYIRDATTHFLISFIFSFNHNRLPNF